MGVYVTRFPLGPSAHAFALNLSGSILVCTGPALRGHFRGTNMPPPRREFFVRWLGLGDPSPTDVLAVEHPLQLLSRSLLHVRQDVGVDVHSHNGT